MYHAKKFPEETMMLHKSQGGGGGEQFANGGGLNGSAVKNVQPAGGGGKQRLRWTSDLHDRFVDAITQLGGPDSEDSQEKQEFESRYVTKREECYHLVLGSTDRLGPVPQTVKKQFRVQELTRGLHTRPISVASSLSSSVPIPEFLRRRTVAVSGATPKGVLRVMGVPGLTIYHVKSHLQKYRLAKYLPESPGDGKDSKDEKRNSGDSISGADSSPGLQINDALRMQMEVQKRLHEQLEVQKQLQMRIEAQGKYLQKIIEEQQKLGSTLAASETLPLSHDKQNQPLSEPSGSSDALAGTFSPHKKQRIDEGSKDGFTASQVTRKTAQKNDCDVGPLDPNLYEDDAGYGFDLETENDDGNVSEQ